MEPGKASGYHVPWRKKLLLETYALFQVEGA